MSKAKIVDTILAKGLSTLDGVRAHTKASSSCGTCTGLVEKLMAITLGDSFTPSAIQAMCACTDLGHDEVRRLIQARELKSIEAVVQELEWKSSCGCAKCRPALNDYLVCDWPNEYADDYQSRFINERAHANIQKDGSYSVVPRMWGGTTSSAQLRAIADVIDNFKIPTVKVTGGQRIDMLGIEKDDLPAVWADLGQAGFAVLHVRPATTMLAQLAPYWALAVCTEGWRLELALTEEIADWESFAQRLFAASSTPDLLASHDTRLGDHRVAAFSGEQLIGALFSARCPVAVARHWMVQQLALKHFDAKSRFRLIAGRPGGEHADAGAIVCSCFGVGINQIVTAITEQGCMSVQAIGQAVQAGTNCGSCRAEIGGIINAHCATHAAE